MLDLDNTVYDWVAYFAPALRGMCRKLSEMTGIASDTFLEELKAVFKRHGTVEYSFALQELPCLIARNPGVTGVELVAKYRSAIDVFQHRRRLLLRPYPGVREGLALLHEGRYVVVGVTDGRRFQAENRLRQLHLDRVFDALCCVPDHAVPDAETVAAIRREREDYYKSQLRTVILLPHGLRKPSPDVLDFVVGSLEADRDACLYVGDSLARDIAMAQRAGIYDCWAAYGAKVSSLDFGLLVRVTDWPESAVLEAINPSPARLGVFPSFTARSFEDVVGIALTEPGRRPARHPGRLARADSGRSEVGPTMPSLGHEQDADGE
jgi:phosphoglycolate phosphatase